MAEPDSRNNNNVKKLRVGLTVGVGEPVLGVEVEVEEEG